MDDLASAGFTPSNPALITGEPTIAAPDGERWQALKEFFRSLLQKLSLPQQPEALANSPKQQSVEPK
jgi:hypothetical protein